jgi:hypothetical protein
VGAEHVAEAGDGAPAVRRRHAHRPAAHIDPLHVARGVEEVVAGLRLVCRGRSAADAGLGSLGFERGFLTPFLRDVDVLGAVREQFDDRVREVEHVDDHVVADGRVVRDRLAPLDEPSVEFVRGGHRPVPRSSLALDGSTRDTSEHSLPGPAGVTARARLSTGVSPLPAETHSSIDQTYLSARTTCKRLLVDV